MSRLIAQTSQLLVFVRYIRNQTIKKGFLFCHPSETINGSDVLKLVEDFFTEENLIGLNLEVFALCTEVNLLCSRLILVKQKNPNVSGMHCIIHREALASRIMPQLLKQILDYAIKVVNFIKSSALNTQLFGKLCKHRCL